MKTVVKLEAEVLKFQLNLKDPIREVVTKLSIQTLYLHRFWETGDIHPFHRKPPIKIIRLSMGQNRNGILDALLKKAFDNSPLLR